MLNELENEPHLRVVSVSDCLHFLLKRCAQHAMWAQNRLPRYHKPEPVVLYGLKTAALSGPNCYIKPSSLSSPDFVKQ